LLLFGLEELWAQNNDNEGKSKGCLAAGLVGFGELG